jgi:hypothetical protein
MPVKKQLKKAIKGFFDFPMLMAHLNTKDPLSLVIRGHLYVEAVLIMQIESALINKGALDFEWLNFPTKVDLAFALGKIGSADVRGFKALNSLRVKFAHKVQMTLTKQDELNLYNTLSNSQRKIIDRPRKAATTHIDRLRFDVMGLIRNAVHP